MTIGKNTAIEDPTTLVLSIFYIAIGIVELGYFAVENLSAPIHIPILGILNIITAYFVFKAKKWALPLVIGLLVTGITFSTTTLFNSIIWQTFEGAILFHLVLIMYMIISVIASIYIIIKKEKLNK